MITPQLDDLLLFTELVDCGSFSEVAARRSITKSAVSKRISKLEQNLGVQLLYRTTRHLTVTEAGQHLYQKAKELAALAKSTMESVIEYAENINGHIRMSVPTISGELLLADAVSDFCELHPDISVEMVLENQLVNLVEDRYDLVVRTAQLADSSLKASLIFHSRWLLCASPSYIEQKGRPKSPADLSQHNCLGYSNQGTGRFEWLFKEKNGREYIQHVNGNFSSNNAVALKIAAMKGRGIAYLPMCLIYDEIQSGHLIELLPKESAKNLGIYALYPFTDRPSKRIRALIDHIKIYYEKNRYRFE